MPRMRTISQTMDYLKQKDPGSAVSEWWLRQNLKAGKIKHHRAGNKFLINLDALEEFLRNPPEEAAQETHRYGQLRRIESGR